MFKDKLKELRENNNYSMDKLAELYNERFKGKLNKSTISRYENGLQEPIYTVVYNFAQLFQITVDEMIDDRPLEKKKSGNMFQNREEKPSENTDDLSNKIIEVFNHLDEEQQKKVLEYTQFVLSLDDDKQK